MTECKTCGLKGKLLDEKGRCEHCEFECRTPRLEPTRADYRNMFEALMNTKQNLKNALTDVEHQIERFRGKL